MKNIKIKNLLLAGASCLLLATSCDVDPTFYSQVVPETYYTNSDAVWSRFNRPFTHWRWWEMQNDARVRCMELGTDAMCVPTRGNDWFDGAVYQNIHHHQFADLRPRQHRFDDFFDGVFFVVDRHHHRKTTGGFHRDFPFLRFHHSLQLRPSSSERAAQARTAACLPARRPARPGIRRTGCRSSACPC